MKLIDADDVIKSLMDMTYYDDEGHTIHDYEDRLALVKGFVDSVPTVDAEPVRHGKWIKKDDGRVRPFWDIYRCSECHISSSNSPFCPNCGAKMEDEEND